MLLVPTDHVTKEEASLDSTFTWINDPVLDEEAKVHPSSSSQDHCANIIGGKESVPHSRPFMALIEGDFICGGTLIKPNWVLTAAHCNLGKNPTVTLGAHSLKKAEPSKQTLAVAKQIRHPCFDPETKENDLMLLQLNKAAKINNEVSPVKLGQSFDDLKAGTACLVTGWGVVANRQRKPADALREVNVTIIDRGICNNKQHYNFHPVVTKNMICAGSKKGGKDACTGDSGGPLICNGQQRGIVSFGKHLECGNSHFPGVYTRLTKKFLVWIKKTIGSDL
ncbi:hypothetical protein JRQ81_012925 [Phrynocephalus forsythii]|uniref:Peptidase S1 domain-containing protein n=1 Tax=Phrynocephalus forsythii TaxID=171643 RepID=A0A9Q0XY57_9SAUR|nr:hypothetical protein JRQ81_012925 [Phrynocephalus forsythii]